MLIMQRKPGESVTLKVEGREIVLHFYEHRRIGIDAPPDVQIQRPAAAKKPV